MIRDFDIHYCGCCKCSTRHDRGRIACRRCGLQKNVVKIKPSKVAA